MTHILAFDTAGPVVGAALLSNGELRQRTERSMRGAESRLVPWMLELLAEAGLEVSQLDGVAVANGPGGFTGLRVGLATAIGVALSAGLPVFPCNSLRSRATRAVRGDRPVLAVLDARKGRVYAAFYSAKAECLHGPGDVLPTVAASWPSPGALVTGEGALVYRDVFESAGLLVDSRAEAVSVGCLARIALAEWGNETWKDPAHVAPVYLRSPDAQKPNPAKLARIRR